jgi:hypothetical protein
MIGRRFVSVLLALVCLAFAAPSWAGTPLPLNATNIAAKGGALASPEKLRRAARVAETSNNLLNPPWTISPARADTTAYRAGDTVTNAGSMYVATNDGTSGSGTPPTATNTGAVIGDGSVLWTWLGFPTTTSSDAQAPTFTDLTAATGLSNDYSPAVFPSICRVTGGYLTQVGASRYFEVMGFTKNASALVGDAVGSRIVCQTDAPKFAIAIGNGSFGLRIYIDGRLYRPGTITPTAGSNRWLTFDFTSTTGRKVRTIEIEGSKGRWYFGGLAVDGLSQVWPPMVTDGVRAVFIGDSMWAGSSYGPTGVGTVPQRMCYLLGWDDCRNFSIGGTSSTNAGSGTGSPFYVYGQRVPEALALNPDVWLFEGSTNDIGQSSATITAATRSALQAVRIGGSTAPIFVFGVWPLNSASVPTVEAAVQAGVTQAADPLGRTYFIPMYGDPTLPWVTGAWNNSANTNSVNATVMISSDATHPPDFGSVYMANRMSRAIKERLPVIH